MKLTLHNVDKAYYNEVGEFLKIFKNMASYTCGFVGKKGTYLFMRNKRSISVWLDIKNN